MLKSIRNLKGFQLIVICLILICIITVFESFSQKKQNVESDATEPKVISHYTPSPTSSQETEKNTDSTAKRYTIKEYNGIIGVFEDQETVPCMTESTAVSSLPKDDMEILKNGISFEIYKDMIRFLQNYE